VRPSEGNDPGEVAYYAGHPSAEALSHPTLFAPPASLFRAPSCTAIDRLVVLSTRSVFVELGAACPDRGSTAPARWVAAMSGGPAAPRVRLAATLVDPPGAAALSVDAEAVDHDGDGVEDLGLQLTLDGGGAGGETGPRVAATFAWLDRPAGLSRDLAATDASFATLAATASARAAHPREAASVPAFVAQVRALYRAVCADGGAPRLSGVAGTGTIACRAARALEQAGLAEVRAYASGGDALRAALALDLAGRPPASRTAARESEAQGWLAQAAPIAVARGVRAVAAVPALPPGREPGWGPLAFEPSGKLLVRTRAGIVRVDPEAGDETAAETAADWKSAVLSVDGAMRWIETYDPCDGTPLRATFASVQGADLRDVVLPVAPPLGGRCTGSRGSPARAVPLSQGARGIEALVEGEPILIPSDLGRGAILPGFLGQPVTLGSPRSPDGAVLVVATGAGILVKRAAHARLFQARELDGAYADQHDCAVSDDAARVACVRAGKAWVGTWDAW
jgi:hypothetical protein